MNSEESSAVKNLEDALALLVSQPNTKINKNIVAKKAGHSHTLLTKKPFSVIRGEIEAAQKKREAEISQFNDQERIRELEEKLKAANAKIKELKNKATSTPDIKKLEKMWFGKLAEMYRFNEELRKKVEALQLENMHNEGDVFDKNTGEVIAGGFGKK